MGYYFTVFSDTSIQDLYIYLGGKKLTPHENITCCCNGLAVQDQTWIEILASTTSLVKFASALATTEMSSLAL